jgi:hypothetical protein
MQWIEAKSIESDAPGDSRLNSRLGPWAMSRAAGFRGSAECDTVVSGAKIRPRLGVTG